MKKIELKVNNNNHKYSIIIGSGVIKNLKKILRVNLIKFNKCLLVVDSNVPKKLVKQITRSLKRKKKIIYSFIANEKNKNQKSVNKIVEILLKNNFHRNDCIITVGGGITGDVSGFASSIFKRGIKSTCTTFWVI